ncbi:putative transmembrane protein [Toxoplasma gondii GAB2-2007-GAL-DOM2]|uniref:Uncharacterized protein n=7 Tax=Toxoplasma gondii TaxID=5811 RepID=A0A125YI20_TOXGG|nr:hypothetical protein TGGT1_244280 [Toxoplasma gondii GT1]ESS31612.1 putative transmembrane protein [Toxoplasma gondii VEG]KAF4643155.1 hypothetical protein TGRH88_028220 [Toxoplasma gondii]KFG34402.1 putative transmembrane protein [Toxoplasma gondii p89]KFG36536.1 putative transmembrane protein [Toxoplasma gondii GAB2-2007-GAL-DOM2]KFG51564.1 putative transmembrane protein [Toxoplasma gondii FOU]KFH04653.1 putative transmembrane protein [Toxoplasma gondii VAND]
MEICQLPRVRHLRMMVAVALGALLFLSICGERILGSAASSVAAEQRATPQIASDSEQEKGTSSEEDAGPVAPEVAEEESRRYEYLVNLGVSPQEMNREESQSEDSSEEAVQHLRKEEDDTDDEIEQPCN